MAIIRREVLSGTSATAGGSQVSAMTIVVNGTATAAFTVLHNGPTQASMSDEVYIECINPSTSVVNVTYWIGDKGTPITAAGRALVAAQSREMLFGGIVLFGVSAVTAAQITVMTTVSGTLFTGFVNAIR